MKRLTVLFNGHRDCLGNFRVGARRRVHEGSNWLSKRYVFLFHDIGLNRVNRIPRQFEEVKIESEGGRLIAVELKSR